MIVVPGAESLPRKPLRSVVTIGNFDGVHRGHRQIISIAVSQAKDRGGTSIAYTFKPHPRSVLDPGRAPRLLNTYAERLERLSLLNLDCVIEEPFSRDFSSMDANRFFKEFLVERVGAESVVVGYDFSFGKGREGQLRVLEDLCADHGVELTIVPPLKWDDEPVSSSRIRAAIESGDVRKANQLLGYVFSQYGLVVTGNARGRELGFPTANIKVDKKVELPLGVYATEFETGGTSYPSVTNIGMRPTFQGSNAPRDKELTPESKRVVETHVMGFDRMIYGESVKISFLERLREERKFTSPTELATQIQKDVERARQVVLSSKP